MTKPAGEVDELAADAETFLEWDLDDADAKLTQFEPADVDEYLLRSERQYLQPKGVTDATVWSASQAWQDWQPDWTDEQRCRAMVDALLAVPDEETSTNSRTSWE
ncbi:MAG: hypothetical protein LH616_01260 [Ilumatobacteraceae bacterium]|nr:hypothetical protein [Ilumatobacteraceae bacterium]